MIYHRSQRGFTIVELMVVLAILMVLVALLTPVYASTVRSSRTMQSLATVRGLLSAVQMYATDDRGALPYLATPGQSHAPQVLNGYDVRGVQGGYFRRQSILWATVVRPYFDANPRLADFPCFRPEGVPMPDPMGTGTANNASSDNQPVFCRYFMTCTAFALPEFWTGTLPADPRHLLQGTRMSHIRQPARKGLLLDLAGGSFLASMQGRNNNDALIGFADGSSRIESYYPVPSYIQRPYDALPFPIMSTEGGLAGIDY